jgi:hypothetical protein
MKVGSRREQSLREVSAAVAEVLRPPLHGEVDREELERQPGRDPTSGDDCEDLAPERRSARRARRAAPRVPPTAPSATHAKATLATIAMVNCSRSVRMTPRIPPRVEYRVDQREERDDHRQRVAERAEHQPRRPCRFEAREPLRSDPAGPVDEGRGDLRHRANDPADDDAVDQHGEEDRLEAAQEGGGPAGIAELHQLRVGDARRRASRVPRTRPRPKRAREPTTTRTSFPRCRTRRRTP